MTRAGHSYKYSSSQHFSPYLEMTTFLHQSGPIIVEVKSPWKFITVNRLNIEPGSLLRRYVMYPRLTIPLLYRNFVGACKNIISQKYLALCASKSEHVPIAHAYLIKAV